VIVEEEKERDVGMSIKLSKQGRQIRKG